MPVIFCLRHYKFTKTRKHHVDTESLIHVTIYDKGFVEIPMITFLHVYTNKLITETTTGYLAWLVAQVLFQVSPGFSVAYTKGV